jgi:1-acyl-sn-glycerol-3-phosphate acyltransferase
MYPDNPVCPAVAFSKIIFSGVSYRQLSYIFPLLVVLYTLVLGSVAIVLCLLVPGGGALMPLGRVWSRLVLGSARVRVRASYDARLDPRRACVYASNHQSQFDIPALVVTMPADFRMVAKRSLLYVPVFGWALWLAGFVFVNRSNRDQAIRSLKRAARRLHRGTSIVVFAEGTRSRDGGLLPFKRGGFVMAIEAGVPVVPVAIRGGRHILPKGSLRVRPGTIEVHFGAPLETSGYDYESRDALMEEVRRAIVSALSPDEAAAIASGGIS